MDEHMRLFVHHDSPCYDRFSLETFLKGFCFYEIVSTDKVVTIVSSSVS